MGFTVSYRLLCFKFGSYGVTPPPSKKKEKKKQEKKKQQLLTCLLFCLFTCWFLCIYRCVCVCVCWLIYIYFFLPYPSMRRFQGITQREVILRHVERLKKFPCFLTYSIPVVCFPGWEEACASCVVGVGRWSSCCRRQNKGNESLRSPVAPWSKGKNSRRNYE